MWEPQVSTSCKARAVEQERLAPPPTPDGGNADGADHGERFGEGSDATPARLAGRVRGRSPRLARHTPRPAVGYTQGEVAELLHVTARTLRLWRHHTAGCFAPLVGRPATRSPRELRNDVIHYLDAFGPGIGLHPLRDAFPALTRAELDDLLHRYRRVWRLRHRRPLHVLEWTMPGAVWAIDLAEAPTAIDGIFHYLLAVRDLASGQQMLWQPLRDATAGAAAEALAGLLALHGAPLVVKSDNGSAFGAPAVATLWPNFGVSPLFSPPHTPSYNGSVEAGIGSLKQRTDAHAARHGRAGLWTWDDVAATRLEANTTARPRGPNGPTPDARPGLGRPRFPPERPAGIIPTVGRGPAMHRPLRVEPAARRPARRDGRARRRSYRHPSRSRRARRSSVLEEVNCPTRSTAKSGRYFIGGTEYSPALMINLPSSKPNEAVTPCVTGCLDRSAFLAQPPQVSLPPRLPPAIKSLFCILVEIIWKGLEDAVTENIAKQKDVAKRLDELLAKRPPPPNFRQQLDALKTELDKLLNELTRLEAQQTLLEPILNACRGKT